MSDASILGNGEPLRQIAKLLSETQPGGSRRNPKYIHVDSVEASSIPGYVNVVVCGEEHRGCRKTWYAPDADPTKSDALVQLEDGTWVAAWWSDDELDTSIWDSD